MDTATVDLLRNLVTLLAVVAGAGIAGLLNRANDRARWQRDWTTERIKELRAFAADVCEAAEQQVRVIGQCADAVRGQRPPVSHEHVKAADAAWGRVLARRYVYALEDLQHALTAFDQARSAAVEVVNAGPDADWKGAERAMEAERLAVLAAVNSLTEDANDALASLLPRRLARRRPHLRSAEPGEEVPTCPPSR